MRTFELWLLVLILLVAGVCCAQPLAAGEEGSGLPGVPVTQEQHHHLVLENPYVKVFEVEVGPHDATLMHQHLKDYTYIVFGDANLTNAVAGKSEAKLKLPDLTVNFSRAPFAHIAANNGDTPFRNITIELLHPQGEMKKFYPSINEALLQGAVQVPGLQQAPVLETEEMKVVAVGVTPNSSWSPANDGHNRLAILIDRIRDTSGPKEKNSPFPAGMLAWIPAGKSWSVPNKSGQEMKLMVLEFKDSMARP